MKTSSCVLLALALTLAALATEREKVTGESEIESSCLPQADAKNAADVYYPPDKVVDANPDFAIEDHSDLGEEGEEIPWDK